MHLAHWSIAQTKDRETEPSGIGWELFLNYRIARDKYQPDYFLYENNKSMSPAIKAQITKELGVAPVLINSALVSAQSRQRLYWFGKRNQDGTYSQLDVEQPEDRGTLLGDILESGIAYKEKSYLLKASSGGGCFENDFLKSRMTHVAEPVCVAQRGRYDENGDVFQHFEARPDGKTSTLTTVQKDNMVAEPVRIGTIENDAKNTDFDSQQYRVYSPDGKSVTMCGNGGVVGVKTGLYATPVRVGDMPTKSGNITGSQNARIYSKDGKAPTLTARPNGGGVDGPLYAIPEPIEYCPLHSCDVVITDQNIRRTYKDGSGTAQGYSVYFDDVKSPAVITGHAHKMKVIEPATGKEHPVYEVRAGLITIKGKQYPIKLADGYYIIRKLTVTECRRLQTVPESYIFPVSDTQAYKMLGNSWTVEIIKHILSHAPALLSGRVNVLSMYDGMSAGMIALKGLGVDVGRYWASEIDKYCIKTTQHNFPEVLQIGDAFNAAAAGWDGVVW